VVSPLGTEEKADSQCPEDIALAPFGVTIGTGFWYRAGGTGSWKGGEVEGLGGGGGEAEAWGGRELEGGGGGRVGRGRSLG
jgi:hypothetical protein